MNNQKKKMLIIKCVIGIFLAIIMTVGIVYLVEMFNGGNYSYFTNTFMGPICLFCLGVVSLLMAVATQKKVAGAERKDTMIVIVGFILIILAFFSLILNLTGMFK